MANERHFDVKIEDLKKQLLLMGGYVEKALAVVMLGLEERNPMQFPEVFEIEGLINKEQIMIDMACTEILAKQAPVAKDLRFVISVLKINTDLERMGDQCVNIAHNGREYLAHPPISAFPEMIEMGRRVREMVKLALDSFVQYDYDKAKKVLEADDQVDTFKNKSFEQLQDFISKNPTQVKPAMNLIFIARNLERLADHATNVAEDVIYAYTGKDIRHGNR